MTRHTPTRRSFLKRTVGVFAAAAGVPEWLRAGAQIARPNVVLILTDNQGYFELSCHGHKVLRTPRIDAFAAEGVDFTQFYAAPYCSPSRGSLMTGRYALRLGIHNTIGGFCILNRKEKTVADYLKRAGYRTGIFGKWHLGHAYPYQPEHRGFDEVFVMRGGFIGQMQDYIDNSYINGTYDHNGTACHTRGHSTDVLFGRAMDFIEANQHKPFFAFISTPAVHDFAPHPAALARLMKRKGMQGLPQRDLNLFSGIENIDDNVGRILDQLQRLGLDRKTFVIVATDQGMYGRGNPYGVKMNSAQGYDSRHHVFCMIRYGPWQGTLHQSNALSGMVDLMPTILDAAGIPIPENVDGRSLRPLVAGKSTWPDDRELIIQCPRSRERKKSVNVSVKTQKWRLVNRGELYNAEEDWLQRHDVSSEHPNIVTRLQADYERFWESLPPLEEIKPWQVFTNLDGGHTRLDAQGWYRGDQPFRQAQLKGHFNGTWAVEVAKAGLYEFDLRRYPKDAPAAIGADKATLTVGTQSVCTRLTPSDVRVRMRMTLTPGRYDMTTYFSHEHAAWGVYFVYVRYVGPGVSHP